jgi:hypothetical protein
VKTDTRPTTPRRDLDAFLKGLDPFISRYIRGRLTDDDPGRWFAMTPQEHRAAGQATAGYWSLVRHVPEQLKKERQRRPGYVRNALAIFGKPQRGAPPKNRDQKKVASAIPLIDAAERKLKAAFEIVRRCKADKRFNDRDEIERELKTARCTPSEIKAILSSNTPRTAATRIVASSLGLTHGSLQTAISRWRSPK